jgi:serine/threonine protein phosphatase 1
MSNRIIYAVGDIHGQHHLLKRMQTKIVDHAAKNHPDREKVVIYLGDYVDRGACSKEVINTLITLPIEGFENIFLKGNHEQMMLDSLGSGQDAYQARMHWINLGGDATMASYTMEPQHEVIIPPSHISWMKTLKLYHQEGEFLFVHAGVRPGGTLGQQKEDDLIWIRETFLDHSGMHPWRVVHGHTPSILPQLKPNRIGIDSSPYGFLTSVVLDMALPMDQKSTFLRAW